MFNYNLTTLFVTFFLGFAAINTTVFATVIATVTNWTAVANTTMVILIVSGSLALVFVLFALLTIVLYMGGRDSPD